MKTIEQLLAEWDNGTLGAEDVAELKRLLAQPEARAALVSDWLMHGAIYDHLREERIAQESAATESAETPAAESPILSAGAPAATAGGSAAGAGTFWRRFWQRPAWPEASFPWRWVAGATALVLAGLAVAGWQIARSHHHPLGPPEAQGPVLANKAPQPSEARVVPPPEPVLFDPSPTSPSPTQQSEPAATLAAEPKTEALPFAGELFATNGEVWLTSAGQTNASKVSGANLALHTGDAIRTGTNAQAHFMYPDGSALTIHHHTEVTVGRTKSGPKFDLERGGVDADVRPQPAGRNMKATTKHMRADGGGTQFRMMADPNSTWIGVRKGKVRVTRASDGQKILLGQSNYAAVHPKWPYQRMDARVCPVWKSVCQQATGSAYP